MLWEWPAYFTKEAIEEGHRRQDLDLGAQRAEHDAGDGQERRQLRQRAADQDGGGRRRLRRRRSRSTRTATSAKAAARTCSSSATASSCTPPIGNSVLSGITRDSVITHRPRPRLRGARADAAARDAVHRRRGVLRRHGGRGDADPVGRPDQGRPRAPRARSPRRSSSDSSRSCGATRRTRTAGSSSCRRLAGSCIGSRREADNQPDMATARQRSAENCRRARRLRPAPEGRQLPDDAGARRPRPPPPKTTVSTTRT